MLVNKRTGQVRADLSHFRQNMTCLYFARMDESIIRQFADGKTPLNLFLSKARSRRAAFREKGLRFFAKCSMTANDETRPRRVLDGKVAY